MREAGYDDGGKRLTHPSNAADRHYGTNKESKLFPAFLGCRVGSPNATTAVYFAMLKKCDEEALCQSVENLNDY